MAMDNGKDAVDSAKVIHVESVDETMNTTLTSGTVVVPWRWSSWSSLKTLLWKRLLLTRPVWVKYLDVGEFEVARFWVQFHGLPTRCLSNDNALIVAKKVGSFVLADDRSKTELVRRGIFGLGLIGSLAHWDKTCHVPMAMVTPKMGKAVQILGTCKRRNPSEKKGGPEAIEKGKELVSVVERTSVPEVVSCHSPRTLDGCTVSYDGLEESGDWENVGNYTVGRCNMDDVEAVLIPPRGEIEARALPSIGLNFLNLPQPDFALVNNEETILDIGPTLAQSIVVPHDWLCLSQKPHSFLKPLHICWPNKDSEAQKLFSNCMDPISLISIRPSSQSSVTRQICLR
uniref:DUF4283 domain-containing protein n=1 Tax=Cannabis sativa TaxID=3483 RepID=A0A803QS91_CANSA